jgi:legumain
MPSKILSAAAMAAVSATASDHWAVIVAGSNTYSNYRHQADTCHAYQIMLKNGVPPSQIIHLAYDDIAHSSQNPFPGQIFNKPTAAGTPGEDVYKNCNIDYKGAQTTAANVIKVLTGDATAPGPVLKSNSESRVFFYFADHGAPGLVAMPVGGYLYADKLQAAFNTMHQKNMYKEMVVYIEACESGSMFPNLPNNMGIYATTAANAKESSWGTYCSPDDKVNGKSIGSCLGDLYSVNWMEDADKAKMGTETLLDQYNTVKAETTKSHVLQFGDLTIDKEPIGNFEAGTVDSSEKKKFWNEFKHIGKNFLKDITHWDEATSKRKNDFAVDSRDIQLHYLYNKVMSDPSIENNKALQEELNHRTEVELRFTELFPQHVDSIKANEYPQITDFDCYRTLIQTYEDECAPLTEYTMKYFKYFVAECEGMKSFPAAIDGTIHRMKNVCNKVDVSI